MKISLKLILSFCLILFILSCKKDIHPINTRLQFYNDKISFLSFEPKESPAINSEGVLLGIMKIRKKKDFDNFQRIWARSNEIHLVTGEKIDASLIEQTIICDEVNRIITIGPSDPDHSFLGNPFIAFYDYEGKIISQGNSTVLGKYKFKVSKKGDIYITGVSYSDKPRKKVLLKINKDGEKLWTFDIDPNEQIQDIALSPNDKKISIALQNLEYKNQIITLTSDGNMIQKKHLPLPTSYFDYLSNDKFIFYSSSRFFIRDEKNLDILYASDEVSASRIICSSAPNGKSFAILSATGEVKVYSLNNDNDIKLIEKTDVDEFENFKFSDLRSFVINNDNSVEICTRRIYFKLFKKSS